MKADIRIVAATNSRLEDLVAQKLFREDLYYRLKVISFEVPLLTDRSEDIPLLAHHFLKTYAEKNSRNLEGFDQAVMEILQNYSWPGNVRELENTIERAVVLARGNLITVTDLPDTIATSDRAQKRLVIEIGTPLKEIEDAVIAETLKYVNHDKSMAAQLLGISARTIYRREEHPSEDRQPAAH